jgi:hypothetical protein
MRTLLAIAVLAAIATAGSAFAATPQQTAMKGCSAKWTALSAADKAKTKHNDFMSTCLKAPATAAAAPAPVMAMKPATGSMAKASTGGQAKCKDGTTVTYKTRSGTCSGHKGVASWL